MKPALPEAFKGLAQAAMQCPVAEFKASETTRTVDYISLPTAWNETKTKAVSID